MTSAADALMEASPDDRGVTRRDGFGAGLSVSAETAASAGAARAAAMVQAHFVMAMQRPRNWDDVRSRLLRECLRPGFAEVAGYSKPVGRDPSTGQQRTVDGLSIRFAEVAIRCMTNAMSSSCIVFEDARTRVVRVSVTDLEGNTPYDAEVVIGKTVERRTPRDGDVVLSSRQNSAGETVYLIEASEDALLNKQNALVSKAIRTLAMRLLPGDIQDDCRAQLRATVAGATKADPDAARKKLVDSFAEMNIFPRDIEEYLGHSVDKVTPEELVQLRAVFVALRDSETTWAAVIDAKREERERKAGGAAPKAPAADPAAARPSKLDRLAGARTPPMESPATVTTPTPDPRLALLDQLRELKATIPPDAAMAAYTAVGVSDSVEIETLDAPTLERLLAAVRAAATPAAAPKPAPTPPPKAGEPPLRGLVFSEVCQRATKALGADYWVIVEAAGGVRNKPRYGLANTDALRESLIAAVEAKQGAAT